jgi:hypothetical protein
MASMRELIFPTPAKKFKAATQTIRGVGAEMFS